MLLVHNFALINVSENILIKNYQIYAVGNFFFALKIVTIGKFQNRLFFFIPKGTLPCE